MDQPLNHPYESVQPPAEIALAHNFQPGQYNACCRSPFYSQQNTSPAERYLPNIGFEFSTNNFSIQGQFHRDFNSRQFQQTQYWNRVWDDIFRNARPENQFRPPYPNFPQFPHQIPYQRYEQRQPYYPPLEREYRPPYIPAQDPRRPREREWDRDRDRDREPYREQPPPAWDRQPEQRRESDAGKTIIEVRQGESIQAALDRAPAGSIVRIKPGIFKERIRITKDNITLQGEKGAILDYSGTSISGAAIQISDRNNVRVEGLEIRNIRGGSTPMAIRVDGASKNVSIVNNDVHHVESSSNAHAIGVFGTKSSPIQNVVIAGNRVHDLKLGQSEAVVINGNVDGFKITDNKIYNSDNIAIDIIGGEGVGRAGTDKARNGVIARNEISNVDSRRNPTYRSACAAGIYVDGGSDVVIEDNIVRNANYGIELASERKGWRTERITVRRNTLESNNLAGISLGGGNNSNGGADNITIEDNDFRGNARTIWRQSNVGRVDVRNNRER